MPEILSVHDVWKHFRIPHEKPDTILGKLASILQIFHGSRFSYEDFWALKGISFTVEAGEFLGLIGGNGSGKSTLLKIIAKIMRPDKGTVHVKGRIAPILELGLGFHPELTTKENVLMYGTIMDTEPKEMKKRLPSILKFSELEWFQDAELKNLSFGMRMRLGFAVAVETDPDIFLVDEALAVGDAAFADRCYAKFHEFKKEKKDDSAGLAFDAIHN